jgi:hypothetical protein
LVRFNNTDERTRRDAQVSQLAASGDEKLVEEPVADEDVEVSVPQVATGYARFFERSGDRDLICLHSDFKGANKKAQQERFILLFVGAYEEAFGTPGPSRDVIYAAARQAQVYDGNLHKYVDRMMNYMVFANGTFKLNEEGRDEANRVSADVADKAKKGFDWRASAKPHRNGGGASNDEKSLVQGWVDLDIDIGKIDVKGLKGTHQAMFALWSLTTVLKVVKAVKPMLAYSYLKQKYTTIGGKQTSLSSAMTHERNRKLFGKNDKGEYFPTAESDVLVETWRKTGVPQSGTKI